MRWYQVVPALILVNGACGGASTEWRPKYPNQVEYKPLVSSAARVRGPSDACTSDDRVDLGVIHANGDVETVDVLEDLAEEAAAHGGTHYVVRGDDTEVEGAHLVFNGAKLTRTRQVWAVVYRCPPAGAP
jgi:hypothetical protein